MEYALLQKEARRYRGALLVEAVISERKLRALRTLFGALTAIAFSLFIGLFFAAFLPLASASAPSFSAFAQTYYPLAEGAFFLLLPCFLLLSFLYAFFSSSYFLDNESLLAESSTAPVLIRYEVAHILWRGMREPTLDFFSSRFGGAVALRAGIGSKELVSFLEKRQVPGKRFEIRREEEEPIDLGAFSAALLSYDEALGHFLDSLEISASDFIGAARWVSSIEGSNKASLRWWSRDALGRIPGVGKDWAYGETILLKRYAIEMSTHSAFISIGKGIQSTREVDEVESILSRGRDANVLLVGEGDVSKLAVLARLSSRIKQGVVLPPLAHKRIFIFDGVPFMSAMKEKALFETEFQKLLVEAVHIGNIILVLDHFDAFLEDAKALPSDLLSLLDPFLASSRIQIVAISELQAFRQRLEQQQKIREYFERVLVEEGERGGVISMLQGEAERIERVAGVLFTYPAIQALAESLERYFLEGDLPQRASHFLLELTEEMERKKTRIAGREDVLSFVSKKTGIAAGKPDGDERKKLLKLEEILHERIVGQEEAVGAVSRALRRTRTGLGSLDRPIGSFLFLGPTGVGKTKTAKALAQALFDDEEAMIRLDMSEYAAVEGLSRLIGTFESGKVGVLPALLRERPFGVLLLDEFEKTHKDVQDLFLQVLDEGFFTDASGRRVNARNLIIIATSNAGSDLIWKTIQEGRDLDKDAVVTDLVGRGIFRPELLSRFDDVVLFRPLREEELRAIAVLELEELAKRLKEKGIEFIVTDSLVDSLIRVGQDPKFGARPMRHAIQEKVEETIAKKILQGTVTAGSRIELSGAEIG